MSLASLFIHTLTIRHYAKSATPDRFGNRPLVHDAALDETVRGRVEPSDSSEELTDRDEQRRTYVVFLPASARSTSGNDRIWWHEENEELRLDGDPVKTYDGTRLHHLEAGAHRITG